MVADTREYQVGDETFYVYDMPESGPKVYVGVGKTDNPRAMASHDGPILDDGVVLHAEYEGGLIEFYHDWMGNIGTTTPRDIGRGKPAVKLNRVSPNGAFGEQEGIDANE